jgi:hypothetical protein
MPLLILLPRLNVDGTPAAWMAGKPVRQTSRRVNGSRLGAGFGGARFT